MVATDAGCNVLQMWFPSSFGVLDLQARHCTCCNLEPVRVGSPGRSWSQSPDQCVCLTNFIWRSTSNPNCHMMFPKMKVNINWHIHSILKCHLKIWVTQYFKKINILNNQNTILICNKKNLSIECKYPSVSHVSPHVEDGSWIHCIHFKLTLGMYSWIQYHSVKNSPLKKNSNLAKQCMFRELVPHALHGTINVVGHWPNKVSTTSVEGKNGENGISPNNLDIGPNLMTNYRALWRLIKIQYHTQVHN